MENFKKGKIFMLFMLLGFRVFVVDCNSLLNEQEKEEHKDHKEHEVYEALDVLDRQEIQLKKLETLVKNLTEYVTRLESTLPDCRKVVTGSVDKDRNTKPVVKSDRIVEEITRIVDKRTSSDDLRLIDEKKPTEIGMDTEPVRTGVSVTKYNPSWSERFQFLSAVKLESEATCINVLPFEDFEGYSKYIAVGDERGKVYVFLPNADVLVEFQTLSESPITAMLSYLSVHKNESVLVTGHDNGVVLVHQVSEIMRGEDWHTLSMENLQAFASKGTGGDGSSITILEVHQVGRIRYILSSDVSGNIRVLRENGTVYGSAISKSRPLAFMKQRLLFLTENGAGSLDLRSMKIRESECEGMNHSLARNYVFDVSERSKAYGFTVEGDLIHVVVLGDIMNFKCRLRSKRKFEMDGPLLVQAIKGYLLVVSQEKVFVYNISSQHYIRVGAPRPLFSASLDEIRSSFLNSNSNEMNEASQTRRMVPLIASDREKLVVLGLGSGYVGMYRSNLPVFNSEFNSMLWTSPVLLFLLFLFGAWHFFGKKREALTLWGGEDPFISSSGATLGPGAGERPFADSSSRTGDLRDLRGGAIRGPTRRYGSPSRFPSAAAIPFRPSTSDPNFRTTGSDHNFRAATDLKYRGAGLESTGFPKRLFPNNQAGEDSSDTIS